MKRMVRINLKDLSSFLKKNGISTANIGSEKMEMIKIGCQLGTLTDEDILKMVDSRTTLNSCNRILYMARNREWDEPTILAIHQRDRTPRYKFIVNGG